MTNIPFAAIFSVLFSFHPALIFYSTLLDTTVLSTFLILFFYYFLWRVKQNHIKSIFGMVISFLLLFFTRSIFQWQWLLLLALSLILMRFPFRMLLLFISITGIVIGLYTIKQSVLFDLPSTSSFTGLNLCQSIECSESINLYDKAPIGENQASTLTQANVLTRIKKIEGNLNLNNSYYLSVNQKLEKEYRTKFLTLLHTPRKLIKLYYQNLQIYLSPSSQYISPNSIVEALPQRPLYDSVFSYPILLWLMTLAFLFWLIQVKKSEILPVIGFCLPAMFIVFICVVGDRGENMRFKFFIEPVFFVFITSQFFYIGKKIMNYIKSLRWIQ